MATKFTVFNVNLCKLWLNNEKNKLVIKMAGGDPWKNRKMVRITGAVDAVESFYIRIM